MTGKKEMFANLSMNDELSIFILCFANTICVLRVARINERRKTTVCKPNILFKKREQSVIIVCYYQKFALCIFNCREIELS
jgi:hypothetical protein